MPARIERPQRAELSRRLSQPRRFLQILAGPRQVGKTTLARQAMGFFEGLSHYATADLPAAPDAQWVGQQWALGAAPCGARCCAAGVGRGARAELERYLQGTEQRYAKFVR